MVLYLYVFFFFKQKTAYEMRISDWSSDVCSSDLPSVWSSADRTATKSPRISWLGIRKTACPRGGGICLTEPIVGVTIRPTVLPFLLKVAPKIGRASCRERVCQYV